MLIKTTTVINSNEIYIDYYNYHLRTHSLCNEKLVINNKLMKETNDVINVISFASIVVSL